MKKIERQLLIYHLFLHNYCVQYDTVKYWLCMEDSHKRTFYRDLKELNDSGLLTVYYDHEEKGYMSSGMAEISSRAQGRYRQHLIRLKRLGRCMCELWQDEVYEDQLEVQVCDKEFWEQNFDPEDYIDVRTLYSCKDCYMEMFPDASERMMQRDFQLLNHIGYTIYYNPKLHYYHMEFPENEDICVEIENEGGKLYIIKKFSYFS